MRRDRLIIGAAMAAGLAIIVALYMMTRPVPIPEVIVNTGENQPGPYLTIEIAGEANGTVVIDLFEHVAPNHVAQITALTKEGAYDNVVFHRVIEGFMAQTGDVRHGKADGGLRRAGTGGSDMPALKAEISDQPFVRGIVGMARGPNMDSANSQFFIMFTEVASLNNQYTAIGQVTEGMEVIDAIKRGHPQSGAISGQPDVMVSVTVSD